MEEKENFASPSLRTRRSDRIVQKDLKRRRHMPLRQDFIPAREEDVRLLLSQSDNPFLGQYSKGLFAGNDIMKGQCVTTMLEPVFFAHNRYMIERYGHDTDAMVGAITTANGLPHDSGFFLPKPKGYLWDAAWSFEQDEYGRPIPPPWWRMNHHSHWKVRNILTVPEHDMHGTVRGMKWVAERDIIAGTELFFDYGDVPKSWSSSDSVQCILDNQAQRAALPDAEWARTKAENIFTGNYPAAITSGLNKYLAVLTSDMESKPPVSSKAFPTWRFVEENWPLSFRRYITS
jgi:hypothetical protein